MFNMIKKNNININGFTLIELLAVITIMGILMMVAIPAVSNTINNSRKDTFSNTAGEILHSVKTCINEDSLYYQSGTIYKSFSALEPEKTYYLILNDTTLGQLMDGGVKSPFGGKTLSGWVKFIIDSEGKTTTSMFLTDKENCMEEATEHNLSRKAVKNSSSCNKDSSTLSGIRTLNIS